MSHKRTFLVLKITMAFILISAMVILTGLFVLFGKLPIQEITFYLCFLDLNQLDMFRWELVAVLIGSLFWLYLLGKFSKIFIPLTACWGIFLGYIYIFPLIKQNDETALFSENYIIPKVQAHKKKNVIIIFWESMEDSFADEELWGENLIPYMSKIEDEHCSFKGYKDLRITRSTIKSQIATFCGIPLLAKGTDTFLPKAWCVPEVLKEQGYYQVFMKASDTRYTNADVFAKVHSFDEVIGRQEFVDNNMITNEQKQGWGVLDSVFMNLAKEKLKELSQKNQPFSLVLTTVNTHYPRGNIEKDCHIKYKDIRDNIRCSDKILYDFVEWFKGSEFAKDTVLFIMGDHPMFINLEMSISPILYRYGKRNTFNTIINGKSKKNQKTYVQFDWAPTILEEIGFTLAPRHFGLGTSLTSPEKSIIEKYGQENLENMIENSKKDFKHRFIE